MTFIGTTNDQSRTEAAELLREEDAMAWGFVPNFARTFTLRPAVYRAWKQLNGAIRATMDPRRYELASTAAAAALHSSYCTLAHGRVLSRDHMAPNDVIAFVTDPDNTPLDATDRAVVALARTVALHADRVTEDDIAGLRACGLADEDIFDVALAAAARCFFAKSLDATGTTPDAAFQGMESDLRHALTVGRPIDQAAPQPATS
jgi:uncharacterized peroxidase-related enzyme